MSTSHSGAGVLKKVSSGGIKHHHEIFILQYPQETREKLATVPLVQEVLPSAKVYTGLSRPNLAKALGDEKANPKHWAVFYVGSFFSKPRKLDPGVYFLTKKGELREDDAPALRGLIFLDGTWSQAKTLWWRNAWLLKTNRAVLIPSGPSLYGELRREPRREYVSTLEAVADAMTYLGEDPAIANELRTKFKEKLSKR